MQFTEFFQAIYGSDREPFPWQQRLAERVVADGWAHTRTLDLPTGSGKTAAIDIAVYHLIHELMTGKPRTAALRIFFVVDRRIVVDGAYRRARKLAQVLRDDNGPLGEAGRLLRERFEVDEPLLVSVMRGGMYRDDRWATSPVQPTVCVSTVDQVGSRLLFRGYGVSASMRPVHAGLIARDSLMLIDEAHLSGPFLETLDRVSQYDRPPFSETRLGRPLQVVRMSATTRDEESAPFQINDEDRTHPILKARLDASKTARLAPPVAVDKSDLVEADREFAQAVVDEALALSGVAEASSSKSKRSAKPEQIASSVGVTGIVVNRVRTARFIYECLREYLNPPDAESEADVLLLTGRIRPHDRDELLFRKDARGRPGWMPWIEAGRDRDQSMPPPIFVVATQTIEVGADLDFDALVTEAAPLDCLRQRFGRLDRFGDRKRTQAVILARKDSVAKNADDRIYGATIAKTWAWLEAHASGPKKSRTIDFGLNAIEPLLEKTELTPLCAPRKQAPVLLPAYIDLWTRTNPAPVTDPDVALFLHGHEDGPALDVQVVWRADLLNHNERDGKLDARDGDDYIDTVAMLPPTSMEACSVPLSEVRRWLRDRSIRELGDVADVEGGREVESADERRRSKLVVCWRGPEKSGLVDADNIRPGDTIVVPSVYGGCDEFGWNPEERKPARDVADACARWSRGRPILRFHPNVIRQWLAASDQPETPSLADTAQLSRWPTGSEEGRLPAKNDFREWLDHLSELPHVPPPIRDTSKDLLRSGFRIIPYELTGDSDTSAYVLASPERLPADKILREAAGEIGDPADISDTPDSDDASSFSGGVPVSLTEHTDGVVEHVSAFATRCELDRLLANDLELAAQWHDLGKIDHRFQAMLHEGDEVAALIALSNGEPLAKSGLDFWDRAALSRTRQLAGVPKGFRHEALSVVLLRLPDHGHLLNHAQDRELVEFLIGSHHGEGRPSYEVVQGDHSPEIDDVWNEERFQAGAETQASSGLFRLDAGWEALFLRLVRRYGPWGLAWLEAVFRLADHQQSRVDSQKKDQTESATA